MPELWLCVVCCICVFLSVAEKLRAFFTPFGALVVDAAVAVLDKLNKKKHGKQY